MTPGNSVFRGIGGNIYGVFEVMMKDLKTAVGVLTEELKKKGHPGKCCGERESWRKVQ
jgi:hypothetical protein